MRLTNTLSVFAVALAFGCAPSNPGIVAEGVLGFDTTCMVTATSPLIAQGVLDIGPPGALTIPGGIHYFAYLKVGNQLINNGQRVYPLMSDPNRVVFHEVEVTLLGTNNQPLGISPNQYRVFASGAAASTTSSDPNFGIAAADVIPSTVGALIATAFAGQPNTTIIVQARVIGTTAGSAEVTSGPMFFPIRLCAGCLFQCARDAMGVPITTPIPSCSPGQDAVTRYGC